MQSNVCTLEMINYSRYFQKELYWSAEDEKKNDIALSDSLQLLTRQNIKNHTFTEIILFLIIFQSSFNYSKWQNYTDFENKKK